ncbi:TRAP transporter substrate-binding protein [Paracoccus aurantiacus]|uniref:TRAP transporter substrate-binding protein n=1 Tax=Paracoccus aurantiacus TaxID=2599412 RepID=A0A5C6RZB6_9RHOB|nr:TRAP transporter substrate-binding protein [Paracoccus aurantiacus]TXB67444.1 TRAP transporter substrate-binding protein [Paracoccus aurantiacus]
MNIKMIAAASALALMAGTAGAETVLRASTFLPPNHTWNHAIEEWGQELTEKSGGELRVEIYPAGQLGPPPRQFDLVTSGAAEMAVILHGATPGRFAMTELAGLPLVTPSAGNTSQIMSRRLTEIAPDFLAEEHPGTKILWMAVTPPLKFHLADTDPTDPAALEGKRIRYAGTVWQQIIEAMGASPVPVPPAEAADAMSKGVVDGATFPYEATQSFDLAPVTKFSMEPGIASATFALVMSQSFFDGLSPELQAIIDETTGPERADWYGAKWDEGEAAGRQYMVDGGVTIVTLDPAQVDELRAEYAPIVEGAIAAVAGGGKPAQEFVDAYTQ